METEENRAPPTVPPDLARMLDDLVAARDNGMGSLAASDWRGYAAACGNGAVAIELLVAYWRANHPRWPPTRIRP